MEQQKPFISARHDDETVVVRIAHDATPKKMRAVAEALMREAERESRHCGD